MMQNKEIYLDNNATTRVLPLAADEAKAAMDQLFGNPSSSHITGLRARHILESARAVTRTVLGAPSGKIVFTSGATEAIETAVFSVLCQLKQDLRSQSVHDSNSRPNDRLLLYGATEHKAVPQALEHWNRLLDLDYQVLAIPVDNGGQLDRSFLQQHCDRTDMICTMSVNNETGVIQDLSEVERVIESAAQKIWWLVDCVQAVGKIELNLAATLIDYATVSGHKLYAPKGIGVLYVRDGAALTPLLAGGGQEGGARGGTENLPGAAAIGAVLKEMVSGDSKVFRDTATLREFRNRLVASLQRAFPQIVFNSPPESSVPTTINFSVRGLTSKEILDLFDAAGVRVSSGSACGSAIQGSYVLQAMGLPQWQSDGAIRVSFGPATTETDITVACQRIEEAGKALTEACLMTMANRGPQNENVLHGLVQLKAGSMCSWILADAQSKSCIVIDPFDELLDRIATLIQCQDLRVTAVLDTHNHVDHDSPRRVLVNTLHERMIYSEEEVDFLGWPLPEAQREPAITLADGTSAEVIRIDDKNVLAKTDLPGHTVDGLAFLWGVVRDQRLMRDDVRFAFTGDTLLIGGIGRTDFPTSAPAAMFDSLQKLPQILSDQTIICPTHDYSSGFVTTLSAERSHNPFLAKLLDPATAPSVADYLNEKLKIDAEINDATNCELVCGRIESFQDDHAASIHLKPDELAQFYQQHRECTILDVREAQEFRFAQEWSLLGFDAPPENVPLTRLANFLADLLQAEDHASDNVIFLCRSGNRSAKAAEVTRRLGMRNVWHVAGGIALGASPSRVTPNDEMEYII